MARFRQRMGKETRVKYVKVKFKQNREFWVMQRKICTERERRPGEEVVKKVFGRRLVEIEMKLVLDFGF